MKSPFARIGAITLFILALAGCGGGGSGSGSASGGSVKDTISAAAAVSGNDTSGNPAASFSVLQGAGVPAVVVNSPPKVNFTVFSGGAVVKTLTTANVSLAIAKLVPGSNGDIDRWVSYVYRTETATAGVGPDGTPALASAKQATTDPKTTTQLVYNEAGYYTYTFSTDIKDPTKTNGVVFEPGLTHRVAIQLSYTNAAGETVRVNPWFDFTLDANGNSVPVTDPSKTRKMVDVNTCNGCHSQLALHGGGRVDTQYCVMCHNPGTTDANSGNVLTLATMAHKIHAGKHLAAKGEHYTIWGFNNSKNEYAEVGFPQTIRNCSTCHSGSNPATPQGDNWKSRPSKEACITCHRANAGSAWENVHVTTLKLGASVDTIPNATCAGCHGAGKTYSAEQVHWVQEVENARLYQTKIDNVTLKTAATATAAGALTVKYSIVNPATGTPYNLREGCSAAATTDQSGAAIVGCNTNYRFDAVLPPAVPGKPQDKFGTFTVYLAVNNYAQTTDDTTATSNYVAYRGVDDGSNRYTVDLPIPAGSRGNARVVIIGSVAERRLDPVSRAPSGAVPPVSNADLAYVPVKNAVYEFDLDTAKLSTKARRQIVSNDKCNACHKLLGSPTESEPDQPGFHKGVRNNSESCEICHNAGRSASYTFMTNGSSFAESYQVKRMVHGIHGGAKRTYPFTHCNNVITGEMGKNGKRLSDGVAMTCTNYPGETDNFTHEVTYPGILSNCNACHVNDSWRQDRGVLGSVLAKPAGPELGWLVISPKTATCTSCHDSQSAIVHAIANGATFGARTQADVLEGRVVELCEGCHATGGSAGVDVKHALK